MFQRLLLLAAAAAASAALGWVSATPAAAQAIAQPYTSPAAPAAYGDPPTRVGRLSEFAGEVQLAGEWDDWRPIPRNHPVIRGDNLYVAPGGRAEIDLGTVQFWLAGDSALYFERVDDAGVTARLGSGAIAFRVRGGQLADSVRIVLDQGEVTAVRPGFYVIHAADGTRRGDAAHLSVRSGVAEVDAGGRRHVIVAGRRLAFDTFGVRYDEFVASHGGFEAWAQSRDRRFDLRLERRTARPLEPWDVGLIGIADLDDHGRWDFYEPYGRVWFPNVSIGWAPYRYGRWIYVRPWGWTWIDDAPWGFAPSHYGRWVRIGSRWAWCPGSYVSRPVYAPALVTFFGGNGWQVSLSTGPAFAWVPLGWNEPYTPWYTYSPAYWRVVNRPYVRNIAEDPWRPPRYVHAGIREAVTSVPVASFLGGRPVAEHRVDVPGIDPRSAPPARIHEYVPQWSRPGRAEGPASPAAPGARPSDIAPVVPGARPPLARPAVTERPGDRAAEWSASVPPISAPMEPRIWQDPNPVVREAIQQAVRQPAREATGELPSERPMMRPPIVREPVTPLPREERRERMREAQPTPPPPARDVAPQRAAPAPAVEERGPERAPARRDGPIATERLVPQPQAPVPSQPQRPPSAEPRERAAPPADGPKPKKDGPGETRP